jgi:ActR/RegA family two-component response regulator
MGPSSSAPHLLVVDDEHMVIDPTLIATLKMHGFSATVFSSPLEALTAARLKAARIRRRDAGHGYGMTQTGDRHES